MKILSLFVTVLMVVTVCKGNEFQFGNHYRHSVAHLNELIQRKNIPGFEKCGVVEGKPNISSVCTTPWGRTTQAEKIACDKLCCADGFLTGHCTFNDNRIIRTILDERYEFKTCTCTHDERDVKCGPDYSVFGFSCPFINGCKRLACRAGGDEDKAECGGFLMTKCTW